MQRIWEKFYPTKSPPKINLDGSTSIYQTMAQAFRKYERNTALTCMGTSVTYGELSHMVNRFADYLKNHAGVKKGDRVAIMLPNIIQFPVAFLAVQKLGGICVNTNPLYTEREMKHQFNDAGATVIVIIDLFADKLQNILADTQIKTVITTSVADQLSVVKGLIVRTLLKIKRVVPKHSMQVITMPEALEKGSPDFDFEENIQLEDVALLQYTGGTTGISKGAMLTQRNILSNVDQIRFICEEVINESNETVLTALPLYHIFCLTVNFLAFMRYGQHLILVPKPIPIENTSKIFAKYPISVMTAVNTLINALNHDPLFKKLAPRNIKFAVAGGMALQESVANAFRNITGVPVLEGYGLTEASPLTHFNVLNHPPRKGSIGVPVIETDCKICDESGNEVAIGEVGELCIRGPQVMKGYWNKPDETTKAIRDGWLWTGDMATCDADGYFAIVDRKKDMVLVSGFNVYPTEVEEVLAMHPKVLEAAVIGVPDEKSGEAVKAFVVKKDPSLTEQELREFCKKELTGYKRPHYYEFRETLPKTNVGKILRRELRN